MHIYVVNGISAGKSLAKVPFPSICTFLATLKKILFRQTVYVPFWKTQVYRKLKKSLIFCLN